MFGANVSLSRETTQQHIYTLPFYKLASQYIRIYYFRLFLRQLQCACLQSCWRQCRTLPCHTVGRVNPPLFGKMTFRSQRIKPRLVLHQILYRRLESEVHYRFTNREGLESESAFVMIALLISFALQSIILRRTRRNSGFRVTVALPTFSKWDERTRARQTGEPPPVIRHSACKSFTRAPLHYQYLHKYPLEQL